MVRCWAKVCAGQIRRGAAAAGVAAALLLGAQAAASAAEPIKVGFGMAMTGGVAHMLPVVPGVEEAWGNLSRRLTFQASPAPVFWTSRPKVPELPGATRVSVAGPFFVSPRFGGPEAAGTVTVWAS